MAEEKKVEKKEDKKDAPKKKAVFGVDWEDIALVLLLLAALFLVIIPRLDTNRSVDMFGGADVGTDTVEQSGTESYGNIKKFYDGLFNSQEKDILGSDGQVISKTVEPSLVAETKFRLIDFLKSIFYIIFFTSIFLTLLFALLLYHNKVRLDFIKEGLKPKKDEAKNIAPQVIVPASYEGDTNGIRNPRWETVEKYYNSGNQSDWRVAIMEADIMLYDLLDSIGIPGDSIGEKLKNTNTSQMSTLNLAWRAHKIRNELAHQGTNFSLSRSMVEEAIENFRKVFDEFSYI